MQLLKPPWVNHAGCAIYSVDIHPNEKRFATGGLGQDCGKIVIWNMDPVLKEEDEKNVAIPKLLCHMDNHLSCVNCVRWSNSGEFLASGSDDKLVIIWKLGIRNIGRETTGEYWKTAYMLRGHIGDVLDVSWSPHDVFLASCSVDNTVIIWNAQKFPEMAAILKGHSGLVKGATWDPTGKYLATQADDKTLRIWRTSDWKQESEITKPFTECGGTTHILRLGWSPDGHYIVSAHAMNNSGPTAQIIERNGWKTNMDFVGHRKAITCVRFNPNILMKHIKKGATKPQQYSSCALGSKDRSISIWMTALKRPLVVIHDLFSQAIMDISWSADGKSLIACSLDGTIAFLQFNQNEIGTPLSPEEKLNMQKKIYGNEYDLLNPANLSSHVSSSAINPSQSAQFTKHQPSNLRKKFEKPLDRQIETRLPNGKRRITPLFITNLEEAILDGVGHLQTFMSSNKKNSDIKIEKRACLFSLQSSKPKITTQNLQKDQISAKDSSLKMISTSSPLLFGTSQQKSSSNNSQIAGNQGSALNLDAMNMKFHRQMNPSKDNVPSQSTQNHSISKERDIMDFRKMATATRPLLPLPKPVNHIIFQISPGSQCPATLDVKNATINGNQTLTTTTLYYVDGADKLHDEPSGGVLPYSENSGYIGIKWKTSFTIGPVNLATTNDHVVCLSFSNVPSVLFMCQRTGRKLMPNLILSSHVSHLKGTGSHILAITERAKLYIWKTSSSFIEPITPVLNNVKIVAITIESSNPIDLDITKNGQPLITFANGRTYTYQISLGSWLLVSNKDDLLERFYLSTYEEKKKSIEDPDDVLTSLVDLKSGGREEILNLKMLLKPDNEALKETLEDETNLHLLRFFEDRCSSASLLNSPKEYLHWLIIMVRHMVHSGLKTNFHALCEGLLSEAEIILGYEKSFIMDKISESLEGDESFQVIFQLYKDMVANKL